MNIPKLRFKDNNGNDYPQWEKKKLEKLVSIYDGTHQTPHYVNNGIKFVSVENIKNLYASDKFISQEAFSKEFKNIPVLNDILMTRIGDVGTATLVTKNEPLAYYVSLALLKQKKEIFMPFLLQYINSNFFQRELWKRTLHIAFPKKINKNEIGKCFIKLPISKEQEKIASFFSTIDKKIKNLENIITNLENQKKGLLQQIFSQKLRFKDKNGNNYPNWEKKKLGDIANSFDYGMNAPSKEFDGINKYIRITDIDEITHKFINKNIVSPNGILDNKYLVNKNDILFARTGASTGKTYIYDTNDGILYFAGFLIRANIPEKYNSYFIFLNTLTQKYKNWVKIESTRSGQPGINAEQYKSYNVFVPCLEEQTKIADFLSAFDRKLDNQKAQLEHWQQIKKGLLQQMFV